MAYPDDFLSAYLPVSQGTMFMGQPEDYVGLMSESGPPKPPIAADPSQHVPLGWDSSGQIIWSDDGIPSAKQWGGIPITAASSPEEMMIAKKLEMEQQKARDAALTAAIRWQGMQDYTRTFNDLTKQGKSTDEASITALNLNAGKMFYNDPESIARALERTSSGARITPKSIEVEGQGIFERTPEGWKNVVPSVSNVGEMKPVSIDGKTYTLVRKGPQSWQLIGPGKGATISEEMKIGDRDIKIIGSEEDFERARKKIEEAQPKKVGAWERIERMFGVSGTTTNAPMLSPTNAVDAFNLTNKFNQGPTPSLTQNVNGVPMSVPREVLGAVPGLTADQQRLYTQTNQFGMPNVEPTATNAVPLPKSRAQWVPGRKYITARGIATWDGEKFVR